MKDGVKTVMDSTCFGGTVWLLIGITVLGIALASGRCHTRKGNGLAFKRLLYAMWI